MRGGSVLGQFGGIILGLSAQSIGLVYLPGTVLLAGASLWAGHLVAEYTARPVLITGLLVLVASGLVMAITASPTMALWVLVLATWLLNLGADLASTPASDTVLADAAPNRPVRWPPCAQHLARPVTRGGPRSTSRCSTCSFTAAGRPTRTLAGCRPSRPSKPWTR